MSRVEKLQGAYDALLEGDGGPLAAIFANDIVWYSAEGNPTSPVQGAGLTGPDQIFGTLFAKLGDFWDDFRCTPVQMHDAGDVVVVEGRYTAIGRATGIPLNAQACHIWTFGDDGLVHRFQQYTDTAQWQRALDIQVGAETA